MNFKWAHVRLTLGYMLLIMLVSGFLSFILYMGGARPLERRLDLGRRVIREEEFPEIAPGERFRPEMMRRLEPYAVQEVKRRLAMFLIYFNIAVLCLAGLLSYTLARRELRPMEEALDLQGRFTSDAAHELRTPLTAMRAEIEVALRGGEVKDGETRELLESNLEEIGKLETLSSSLLKLAQYEKSAGAADMGPVQIGAVVQEALEKVKHKAAERDIDFDCEIEEATVSGDRASLVELLVILLDNSVKYSDENKTVKVSSYPEKRNVLIKVRDEGYGINEADLGHLFDRFYRGRVPPSKKQVEGYGLGLSIARRIAEMHRGSIEISSIPDMGTTVTVELPLAREKRPGHQGPDT